MGLNVDVPNVIGRNNYYMYLYIMSTFKNNKNQVKLIFLKDDIKCNNLSFYFYDERRNENVIRAVYDLIRNFCIQNIYYPPGTTMSIIKRVNAFKLIMLDCHFYKRCNIIPFIYILLIVS